MRIVDPELDSDLGVGPTVLAAVLAGGLGTYFLYAQVLAVLIVGNEAVVLTNLALLGTLVVVNTIWLWAVSRGHLSSMTGGGLTLAGYALSCRFTAELLRTVLGRRTRALRWATDDALDTLAFARGLGFVAYIAGLALFVSACFAERRLRGQTPAPRKLGGGIRRKGERRLPSVFR